MDRVYHITERTMPEVVARAKRMIVKGGRSEDFTDIQNILEKVWDGDVQQGLVESSLETLTPI